MSISPNEEILTKTLERMLFNEQDFTLLRGAIEDLASRKIIAKELRGLIVDLRLKIFKELKEFFIFYIKEKHSPKVLSDSHGHPDVALIEELSEKNDLLEQLGQRMDAIYNNLKSKESLE